MLKPKTIGFALVILSAVGLGTGLSFLPAPVADPPAASPPNHPPAKAKNEPRVDRYGDPLPEGAIARLGSLRFRAPGEIVGMAFAPDGKTLAVSWSGGLFLMDAENGKQIKQVSNKTISLGDARQAERLICFAPDGKSLLSCGYKQAGQSLKPVVRVWELSTELKMRQFDIGEQIVWLGWSDEGKPLAIRLNKDGSFRLHDLTAGQSQRFACDKPYRQSLNDIAGPPIACSPHGRVLAFADGEHIVHVWDTTNGRLRSTLHPKGERIDYLTLSPDGNYIVSRTSKAVQMWETATGKRLYTLDEEANYNSSPPLFAANGKTLAVLDSSPTIFDSLRTIRFRDAATGKERACTQDRDDFSPSLALSDDGKRLASASRYGVGIDVWDVATGKRKAGPMGHAHRPQGIVFSPDGSRIATGGTLEGVIRFWNRADGETSMCIRRSGKWVRDIALSSDGRLLFSTWEDENVWISDAASGERRHLLKLEDPDRPDTQQSATSMRLSEDGKRLLVFSLYYSRKNKGLANDDTSIAGWDVATHKLLFRRRRPGMEAWPVVSPDARSMVVPQNDDSRTPNPPAGTRPLQLEDVATGEKLLTLPKLSGEIQPLDFSTDGRLLALKNTDYLKPDQKGGAGKEVHSVRLWEMQTASEVLSLTSAELVHIAFSRDNRLLAFIDPEREIVVWDLLLGRERRRFKGYDSEMIFWLRFSPDGRQLVSCLSDSTLLIWDVPPPATPPQRTVEEATGAWKDLASRDAALAFRARGMLALSPKNAIPLLSKHLHPAKSADLQRLRQLLAALDSDLFTVREKAQEELVKLGDLAEPALRRTLEDKPTLEVRKRVQTVLERLRGPVTRPEVLQALRAVAALEDIGTPEARRLLDELTQGAPEARLTREAKASLERLRRRTVGK